MARPSDPKKSSQWWDRFQRFLTSDLTDARFCVMEHVSVASFYHWRKKIGPPTRHKAGLGTHTPRYPTVLDARLGYKPALTLNSYGGLEPASTSESAA